MNTLAYCLLLALIIWVTLKFTFAAVSSPVFWVVFVVLLVLTLVTGTDGRWF